MAYEDKLKQVFGHESFRDGQEEVISAIMRERDVLAIMPTGAGKSICYQLPAVMKSGITLVISPLISLMKDQVMSLKSNGVPAAYINSSLTPSQQTEALRRASLGAYRIIYVAPERLDAPTFLSFAQNAPICQIVVDEAHCVSLWGQDFRPGYLRIQTFIASLPHRPPLAAFTATATERVKEDMIRLLGLQSPVIRMTGFDRKNLHFRVVKPTNKYAYLSLYLEDHGEDCGIIYCATRKAVEEICEKLQNEGYSVSRYHAGLSDQERKSNQDDFRYDRVKIMVATNAFGMGIDKPDVRFVVHFQMPPSMEAYYQEAGRAGRDGLEADCVLLYSGQDVIIGQWMIDHEQDNPELSETEKLQVKKGKQERLRQMTFYATGSRCLRARILQYFGERGIPEHCDHCSVCLKEPYLVDCGNARPVRTREQKKIRSLEKQAHTCPPSPEEKNLNPEKTPLYEDLKKLRLMIARQVKMPAFCIANNRSLSDMVIRQPRDMDELLQVYGMGETLCCQYGKAFLSILSEKKKPEEAFQIYLEQQEKPPETRPSENMTHYQNSLYENLVMLRNLIARQNQIPAFMVLSNASLLDMVQKLPKNQEEFLGVPGIGQKKCQEYSEVFLAVLRDGQEPNEAFLIYQNRKR